MTRKSNVIRQGGQGTKHIKEVNRCNHIDRSDYQKIHTLEELEGEIQEKDSPSEVMTTAIVSRKPCLSKANKSRLFRIVSQRRRHKSRSGRTKNLVKRILNNLFTKKKDGKIDHQSLVEIQESLSEIIAYHNQVGQTLAAIKVELQKQNANNHHSDR